MSSECTVCGEQALKCNCEFKNCYIHEYRLRHLNESIKGLRDKEVIELLKDAIQDLQWRVNNLEEVELTGSGDEIYFA